MSVQCPKCKAGTVPAECGVEFDCGSYFDNSGKFWEVTKCRQRCAEQRELASAPSNQPVPNRLGHWVKHSFDRSIPELVYASDQTIEGFRAVEGVWYFGPLPIHSQNKSAI